MLSGFAVGDLFLVAVEIGKLAAVARVGEQELVAHVEVAGGAAQFLDDRRPASDCGISGGESRVCPPGSIRSTISLRSRRLSVICLILVRIREATGAKPALVGATRRTMGSQRMGSLGVIRPSSGVIQPSWTRAETRIEPASRIAQRWWWRMGRSLL